MIVAPYVYACWQIRWKVRNEEVRSDERGADGSDAVAGVTYLFIYLSDREAGLVLALVAQQH
jgi:hypothetical protein